MKKHTSIIILLLLVTAVLEAQYSYSEAYKIASKNQESVPITATLFINEHPSKKEQFTSDWKKGDVIFSNGTKATNKILRYNCWKDELIWLRDTDYKRGTIIKDQVKEFYIGNKKFINYYDNKGIIKQNIYLEVLAEGNVALYCHRKVSYIKSSNKFTKVHQYYLKKEGELKKINFRKSSLMDSFTEKEKKALKSILRENRLKFKDEYQLAKAIYIFNKKAGKQD